MSKAKNMKAIIACKYSSRCNCPKDKVWGSLWRIQGEKLFHAAEASAALLVLHFTTAKLFNFQFQPFSFIFLHSSNSGSPFIHSPLPIQGSSVDAVRRFDGTVLSLNTPPLKVPLPLACSVHGLDWGFCMCFLKLWQCFVLALLV